MCEGLGSGFRENLWWRGQGEEGRGRCNFCKTAVMKWVSVCTGKHNVKTIELNLTAAKLEQ